MHTGQAEPGTQAVRPTANPSSALRAPSPAGEGYVLSLGENTMKWREKTIRQAYKLPTISQGGLKAQEGFTLI